MAGEAEPVGVDSKGKMTYDVRTITLESRELEGNDDRVLRKTRRAASAQALLDSITQVTHPCLPSRAVYGQAMTEHLLEGGLHSPYDHELEHLGEIMIMGTMSTE